MQITKTHKIIISIIAIAILLGIYIFFDMRSRNEPNEPTDITSESLATTTDTNIINVEGTGSYTIEQVSDSGNSVPQPVPDLNRKIVVYSGAIIAPESTTVATEKILSLQTQLKQNPADRKAWINLGIYQKTAGDYEGASISWKYASKLSSDYVPLANLGNLYAYFLKDNGQAEVYYKEAISKAPMQAYLYVQLAEAYRDIFKDLDKARAIITQGLSQIPNDPNLLQFQASLR